MDLLHKIAWQLRKSPTLKKFLKSTYFHIGLLFSDRKTSENVVRVSSGEREHLFGYYDKSPWDATCRYMVYLATPGNVWRDYSSNQAADIILMDFASGEEKAIAQTHSWNSQQGCMLQWLGPDFSSRILYNDFRNGKLCAVIHEIASGAEKILPMPVYTVSKDGTRAVTLDFLRLNTLRPGYGYCNLPDQTCGETVPDGPCIWNINLVTGETQELFTYRRLFEYHTRDCMKGAFHKINHIMLNPSGNRFMFLHRWLLDGVKYDRMITANYDGSDPCLMMDDDMVSHSNWKDDENIVSFANSKQFGNAYHLLKDHTQERKEFGAGILNSDGHPSYSPDGKYLVTDTYPNFHHKQKIYLCDLQKNTICSIVEIYHNTKYHDDTRCDLHPRWRPDSREICVDGACEAKRQVYKVSIP